MILFRAVFMELIGPFWLTLLVMVGLLMTEKVYRLVNLVVERRLNMGEVGWMLTYLIPQLLEVTLPLAVVGAVFVTVIRQSMDSEVISIRATGRPLWSYALPFLAFGVLVTVVAALNSLWLQPAAANRYGALQVEMVRWRAEEKLVPGEFNYDFGDKVIRVGSRAEVGALGKIFIADRRPGAASSVITANTGRIAVDEEQRRVVFRLQEGTVHTLSPDGAEFRTVGFGRLRYALEYEPAQSLNTRTVRGLSTARLMAAGRDAALPRRVQVGYQRELYRRFAAPWASIAFALAALPMALVDPRSGKRAGYLRAIFLVAAYFIVWSAFKDLVGSGKADAATLFLPAILILLYGSLRLWQINADLESLWRAFRR